MNGQAICLHLLGVVYLCAFSSLLWQVRGLYARSGILPIRQFLRSISHVYGRRRFVEVPTLFWLGTGDGWILSLAWAGTLLSLLLLADVYPVLILALLFALYLSFVSVGQDFLSFQWDRLLLEVSFLAFFFALQTPPSPLMLLAWWFLLARLMWSSGLVKFLSGDPNWRNGKALCFHYETQPLPNRVAWYMHQLPVWAHQASTFVMFAVELLVPFLIFGPFSFRFVAFCVLIFFQILLIVTGNFAFFNLLTIAMCMPLLSSIVWSNLLATPLGILCDMAGLFFIAINCVQLLRLVWPKQWMIRFLQTPVVSNISSSYGLFAVMTTERLELVIEGSDDKILWQPYAFRHKPGRMDRPPTQIAPFQPRLDWQMWFAALRGGWIDPWLRQFLNHLLMGSPHVLALLKENPFPVRPPKYLRIGVYRYHFTDRTARRETGQWWRRVFIGQLPLPEDGLMHPRPL